MAQRRSNRTSQTAAAEQGNPAPPPAPTATPQVPQQDLAAMLASAIERLERQADQVAQGNNDNTAVLRDEVTERLRQAERDRLLADTAARRDRREFNVGANNILTYMRQVDHLRSSWNFEDLARALDQLREEIGEEKFEALLSLAKFRKVSKSLQNCMFEALLDTERVALADRLTGPHRMLSSMRDRLHTNWVAHIRGRDAWTEDTTTTDRAWLARESKDIQSHLDSAAVIDSVSNSKKRHSDGNRGGRQTRGRGGRNNRGGGGRGRGNNGRQAAPVVAEAVVGE